MDLSFVLFTLLVRFIFQLNLWCDRAMSLLAGQGIEKAQSLEGAQQVLTELEDFFGKKVNRGPVSAELVSTNLEVTKFNSHY